MMRKQPVSHEQFAILCSELLLSEMAGYNPRECVTRACKAAGIKPPKEFESVEFVIQEAA